MCSSDPKEIVLGSSQAATAFGVAERKLELAASALADAKSAAKVRYDHASAHTPPSPRDWGRTSIVRLESLTEFPAEAYTDKLLFCTQNALILRTGIFQSLLEQQLKLKKDLRSAKDSFKHSYNELVLVNTKLKGEIPDLTGTFFFPHNY